MRCNYTSPLIFILHQPRCRKSEMTYYQQTVLMPLPRQHKADVRGFDRRTTGYRDAGRTRMGQNRDVNTILSFFE